jgi:TRAP-type C4-dicarboxylate transport system permease large subunit
MCCLAAVMLIATPIVFAGFPQALKEAVSGDSILFVVAATAIAYAVLAYFVTPILAMALLLPLTFRLAQDAGVDTTFAARFFSSSGWPR